MDDNFAKFNLKKYKKRVRSWTKKGPDGRLLRKKVAGELYLSEGIYSLVPIGDTRISRFINEMQKAWSNGGAWIYCVEASTPVVNESMEYQDYWIEFFKSPSLRALLPELKIPDQVSFPKGITSLGRHQFEGMLTDILLGGGAYDKFQGSTDEARQITRECVDALNAFLQRPNDSGVLSINGGWTPAFWNVAWDATFILELREKRKWILMWMTDTD